MNKKDRLGAVYLGDGRCRFLVWAPLAKKVDVHITSPEELTIPLKKDEHGYRRGTVNGVMPGSLYFYQLDEQKEHPDSASLYQPHGVHMLIRRRRGVPALACRRWTKDSEVVTMFNINKDQVSVTLPVPAGRWRKELDSSEKRWRGIGSATPEQIISKGDYDLVLNPWAVTIFIKEI